MPYDIATQIAILSSQKVSGHITGQVLMIEGGMEGGCLNTKLFRAAGLPFFNKDDYKISLRIFKPSMTYSDPVTIIPPFMN